MLTMTKAARMCPKCAEDSFVYDSRERPDGVIVRKRRCKRCGTEFKTEETLAKIYPKKIENR